MPEIIPLSCSNWDGSSYCDYSAQLIQQKKGRICVPPFQYFIAFLTLTIYTELLPRYLSVELSD